MTVGSELVNARTSLRLNIEEVSKKTRIRESNLRKLEADQLEDLGAEVYVVGWLRACAQVLRLEPDALIATYRSQVGFLPTLGQDLAQPPKQGRVVTTADVAQLPVAQIKVIERKAPRDRPNWSLALAGVFAGLLVIAGFAVVGRLVMGDGLAGETVAVSQTQAETVVVDSRAPDIDENDFAERGLTAAVPSAPVQVVVRIEGGKSWVRVVDIEDTEIFEGTLDDGQERVFTDSAALSVVVGNAGVVSFIHNGVDLGKVGGTGQVVRLSFDADLNIG